MARVEVWFAIAAAFSWVPHLVVVKDREEIFERDDGQRWRKKVTKPPGPRENPVIMGDEVAAVFRGLKK
jgi:hypothetical protein